MKRIENITKQKIKSENKKNILQIELQMHSK